ncbi:restriction endonuclease subunit S [Vibrio cholerae]|uniref:restriction endonuclease subunit S n=1 Tax=Vibrio cholerae TaxID=666 RepID=UPI0029EF269F|nr:restriction endonuclease subunit S [Vibrio cholerae]EHD2270576.1 restriction endonuclease subunit S [Vibrio cholerae]
MGSNWKTARLLDQYEVRSGISKPAKDFGTGYPFLTFKDVFYNYFTPEVLGDLVESTDKERDGCSVKRGDVFLTRTSETMNELGMSCVALKDYEGATFNGFCKRLRPNEQCELVPEYVGYYLRSPKFRQAMVAFSTMSTRASLNNEMIGRLEISYPSKEAQRHIAHVLKTLDNKITLNRQINQTLEQMAQALFKSWFVDFDPVMDNALDAGNPIPDELQHRAEARKAVRESEGFKPLPDDVRQLFPDTFEESDLGWVPKGWGVGCLANIASYTSNRVATTTLSLNNYVSTENMLVEKKGIVEAANLPTVNTVPAYTTGNVLISNIRPYFKKIWMANGDGGHSNDVLGFEVKEQNTEGYLFNLLYQDALFEFMMTTAKGSKMPRGDKKAILDWQLVIPPCELREYFSLRVGDFYVSSSKRTEENKTLTKLRDTLLPKLISGELRLDEIELAVEQEAVSAEQQNER